jgi:hypothetical protein
VTQGTYRHHKIIDQTLAQREGKNDIIKNCQIQKLCDKKMQSQYHQNPKRKPETTII